MDILIIVGFLTGTFSLIGVLLFWHHRHEGRIAQAESQIRVDLANFLECSLNEPSLQPISADSILSEALSAAPILGEHETKWFATKARKNNKGFELAVGYADIVIYRDRYQSIFHGWVVVARKVCKQPDFIFDFSRSDNAKRSYVIAFLVGAGFGLSIALLTDAKGILYFGPVIWFALLAPFAWWYNERKDKITTVRNGHLPKQLSNTLASLIYSLKNNAAINFFRIAITNEVLVLALEPRRKMIFSIRGRTTATSEERDALLGCLRVLRAENFYEST